MRGFAFVTVFTIYLLQISKIVLNLTHTRETDMKKFIAAIVILLSLSACATLDKYSATPRNGPDDVKEFRVVGAYARGYR